MKYSIKNLNQFVPLKIVRLIISTSKIQLFGIIIFSILAFGTKSNKNLTDKTLAAHQHDELKTTTNVNCLEPFYGKPENILTKEMVAKYVDFQGAEVESQTLAEALNQTELSKGYIDIASIQFKWKINRQRSNVSLGKIKKIGLYKSKTPVERFYAKYHNRSPEEQAELKKLYDSLVLNSKELKQKTDNSNAKLLSEAVGFDYAYLNIEGIGDAAVWEHKINDLIVLVGDYQFTVNVDLNIGNDHDLEKAKLIAKAIIEKACN